MQRQGVTADTAGQSENGFTFNDVLVMLFLDIIIFSFLAWYAGHVRKQHCVWPRAPTHWNILWNLKPCWFGV